ncbi:dihydroorotate dehydrogenase electron transfer subunit [Treponema sp. HNW]|uniref:dihydroorotate dehydrogenase electron transfer subunit n=1 Tax=Treponema sp. HNW TaxID=3116654 RepID=UPI003D14D7C9
MIRNCTRRNFEKVRVLSNLYAGGGCYCITVVPEAAAHTRPLPSAGCFYMLSLNDSSRMLPRPLSLYSFDAKTGETGFLYRPMGEGTRELSLYAAGNSLHLHGPLGRGFDIPSAVSPISDDVPAFGTSGAVALSEPQIADPKQAPLFIVAGGGIGLAPLNLAVREILKRNPNSRILFIAGGKDESIKELIDFFRLPAEVELILCTDDGSAGKKGFVPDILAEYLKTTGLISAPADKPPSTAEPAVSMLYACGPNPMLEKLAAFSNEYGIPCQISLERRMACGSAACMGCSVKTCGGMKKVCADGPVFDAKLFKDIG